MTTPDNGTAISTAQQGRRYDIDLLRVLAFSLLISLFMNWYNAKMQLVER